MIRKERLCRESERRLKKSRVRIHKDYCCCHCLGKKRLLHNERERRRMQRRLSQREILLIQRKRVKMIHLHRNH
jgi:hypothetical protein